MRLAYFVSPHGFGHAARSAAVISALRARLLSQQKVLQLSLFTTVPRWFFEDSFALEDNFEWFELACDVGLAQKSALEVDLDASVSHLEQFWEQAGRWKSEVARKLNQSGCDLVICDISPLGLAVATEAKIPSVLVENFTWDWIYAGYFGQEPRLGVFADRFRELFDQASQWIQTTPACEPRQGAERVAPVSRRPNLTKKVVRTALGIEPQAPTVLVTMGGIGWEYKFLEDLKKQTAFTFVVPGAADAFVCDGNLRLMPHRSSFYHPDLVHAVDVVVGKLGYSTVAEVHDAAARFLFVERPGFAESDVLARFVERTCPSEAVSPRAFERGLWLEQLESLLKLPRPQRTGSTGADQIAAMLSNRYG